MQPLYQQFGLDEISTPAVLETIDKISDGLHGYGDNGPVQIAFKRRTQPAHNSGSRIATLRALANHDILTYEFDRRRLAGMPSGHSTYSVIIKNRYKFERLCTELSHQHDPFTVMRLKTPNLIYYNPVTREGTFNGEPLKFNKKSKQGDLFELLFDHAPESVPRERVIALLRLGNSGAQTDRLNTAISNLCTKCKVKRDVITVSDNITLNAVAITVDT